MHPLACSPVTSRHHGCCRSTAAMRRAEHICPGVRASAGPCSRALLQCLLALRNPSKTRLARGATAFDLEVVHVDEGAAWGHSAEASAATVDAVRASAQHGIEGHDVSFHAIGLEDVFCEAGAAASTDGRSQQRQRLTELVQASARRRHDIIARTYVTGSSMCTSCDGAGSSAHRISCSLYFPCLDLGDACQMGEMGEVRAIPLLMSAGSERQDGEGGPGGGAAAGAAAAVGGGPGVQQGRARQQRDAPRGAHRGGGLEGKRICAAGRPAVPRCQVSSRRCGMPHS